MSTTTSSSVPTGSPVREYESSYQFPSPSPPPDATVPAASNGILSSTSSSSHKQPSVASNNETTSLLQSSKHSTALSSYASVADPSVSSSSSSSSHFPHHHHHHHHNVSRWLFWKPQSPSFRFFVLGLAILMPFGGHVVKASLSSLANFFFEDEEFHLTHAQFGSFQSALSVPNLFIPLMGGIFLDVRSSRNGTLAILFICLLGHVCFTLAVQAKNYYAAVLGRALFGLGQGSTVVAQGRIAATWFAGHELVLAVALTESMHNVSNWLGQIYVVPVAKFFNDYVVSLWFGVGFCLISFIAGVIFFKVNPDAQPDTNSRHEYEIYQKRKNQSLNQANGFIRDQRTTTTTSTTVSQPVQSDHLTVNGPDSASSAADNRMLSMSPGTAVFTRFSIGFVILCFLHLVFSNVYHLFGYISANFLQDKYGMGKSAAAFYSSLSYFFAIFLCPLFGWLLDRIGYKMWACVGAGIFTCGIYLMMAFTDIHPAVGMIGLSFCISFVPTVLRAAVPNLVHASIYGTAYGLYSISESLGAVAGHGLVGYVRDTTHSYQFNLQIFAGMAVIAAALALMLSIGDALTGGDLNKPSIHHECFHPDQPHTPHSHERQRQQQETDEEMGNKRVVNHN